MIEHSSFQKLVGATLGNYHLEQLIGRNTMGPVFTARSTSTSTKTAYLLRILDIPDSLSPEARIVYLGKFQHEANQIAALHHPGIWSLLDYGHAQGMPYLVYPSMTALTPLKVYLAQHSPLDLVLVSRYLDQIASALEYAHQHAVLHRNLTVNSLFIDAASVPYGGSSPTISIADFGVLHMLMLAEQLVADNDNKGEARANNAGQVYLKYASTEALAPEQVLGRTADTASDIYALGAVLYRLLTGQRVFTGNTREEIVQQHLHAPVPPLHRWRKDVSPKVDSVLASAMAKEPAQRFRQATALADAYHEAAVPQDKARTPLLISSAQAEVQNRYEPGGGQPDRGPIVQANAGRRTRQVSRRRVLFSLVVGGGVAAAAVTTVALFGNRFLSGSSATTTTTSASSSTTAHAPAATAPAHSGTVIAHTTEIPVNGAKNFSLPNHSNPGILVHLSDNRFVAFDSTCTHAGCAVNYNSQNKLLECPCHSASFDPAKNAAVVQGPAQTPLAPVAITVNPDTTITMG